MISQSRSSVTLCAWEKASVATLYCCVMGPFADWNAQRASPPRPRMLTPGNHMQTTQLKAVGRNIWFSQDQTVEQIRWTSEQQGEPRAQDEEREISKTDSGDGEFSMRFALWVFPASAAAIICWTKF